MACPKKEGISVSYATWSSITSLMAAHGRWGNLWHLMRYKSTSNFLCNLRSLGTTSRMHPVMIGVPRVQCGYFWAKSAAAWIARCGAIVSFDNLRSNFPPRTSAWWSKWTVCHPIDDNPFKAVQLNRVHSQPNTLPGFWFQLSYPETLTNPAPTTSRSTKVVSAKETILGNPSLIYHTKLLFLLTLKTN